MSINYRTKFLLFVGHGRGLESWLVGLKILIFVQALPLWPGYVWPATIPVLTDTRLSPIVIALPFAIIAAVQGFGLWLNYRGYEISWLVRAVGSFIALVMWFWILLTTLPSAWVTPFIMPLAVMGFVGSVFILWKAINRLPAPGAPGLQ